MPHVVVEKCGLNGSRPVVRDGTYPADIYSWFVRPLTGAHGTTILRLRATLWKKASEVGTDRLGKDETSFEISEEVVKETNIPRRSQKDTRH